MLLTLKPLKEREINGVGMGVLSDGTPYLTGKGLSRMCGIDDKTLREIAQNWSAEQTKPRGMRIADLLHDLGHDALELFIPITVNGSVHNAYPESVCMAFLEYYAFEAGENTKDHALKNYRLLARSSFRVFVYTQVGYDSKNRIPDIWKQYHDRVSTAYNSIPSGYFSVFKEIADIAVTLIQNDIPVDDKTVPDVSVGRVWSEHWNSINGDSTYGQRKTYEHNFPEYFPQAAANPQKPWVYPESALPEFRRWMRSEYLPNKFPAYLQRQAKLRAIPPSIAEMALEAFKPLMLPDVSKQ